MSAGARHRPPTGIRGPAAPAGITALALAAALALPLRGQEAPSTVVDPDGVMRWAASREEVVQFGVNYTAPFAYSFRAHGRLGIPIEKAIDADVYHFARLGLDAYRVHVWDREISDPAGNLVVNEHVRAFDYLLAMRDAGNHYGALEHIK